MNTVPIVKIKTVAVMGTGAILSIVLTFQLLKIFPEHNNVIVVAGLFAAGSLFGLAIYFLYSTRSVVCISLSKSYGQHDWTSISKMVELKRISFTQAVCLMLIYGIAMLGVLFKPYRIVFLLSALVLTTVQYIAFWRLFRKRILEHLSIRSESDAQ